ncbi:CgeB family protein [Desulfomonile tiedjei]|uniref:Spore protein YkvP/CgeB glycosyl transferase-like domain-containing protein n=1 Tax=Desulfomonile tiedjei (strain ATCC 49306 / DSM 6799 / DCB-1) TaxID=706587 RepID=I4C681_DESTA|nr:glycosyltransferase [Desulfomonile tiedjei]AFM25072.1 hypothetical protein Desti_2388 [Desulfomonile tiedjei DSM 6799]
MSQLNIVIFGLSITSSWGNGHAVTYRGLVAELARLGHKVTFLEQDAEWYASHRDMPYPQGCKIILYKRFSDVQRFHLARIRSADMVIIGSYVSAGIEIGNWILQNSPGVVAFYDIDTPVTLAAIARGACQYLTADLIPEYDLYLSFTGGPVLKILEDEMGSPCARTLYCSVDPSIYRPETRAAKWDLGYLGTYSPDRQPKVEQFLNVPASQWENGKFVVAGPQYPSSVVWSQNVHRIDHVPPGDHRSFYNSQRFTLNVTRSDMIRAGWSPSIRLFEAAACGIPIVSDWWQGLDHFFVPGEEILVAQSTEDILVYLHNTSESERKSIGYAARKKILSAHTSAHRAAELEEYAREALKKPALSKSAYSRGRAVWRKP